MSQVNIIELTDKDILDKIEDHQKKNGVLRISVFQIRENYLAELPDEYTAHLIVARQTLEKENYLLNFGINKIALKNKRLDFTYARTDFDKLDSSGQKLELKQFLGPCFDLERGKPLVRGQLTNETLNSYFYYDSPETSSNKVDINQLVQEYEQSYPGEGWFMHAFAEPPYNMDLGKDIYVHGQYIIDFLDYFFGTLTSITAYSWNNDCSPVFDPGKEWWGSYFWTVYNPEKQWYVGIIASETD